MSIKKGTLDSYSLMVVSKYFKTIDDFINLELATPKAKGNMSKFHFNPIPLNMWSRKFFTSLETLHLYDRNNCHFRNEKFYQRVYWYEVFYGRDWEQKKNENGIFKILTLFFNSVKNLVKKSLKYLTNYLLL